MCRLLAVLLLLPAVGFAQAVAKGDIAADFKEYEAVLADTGTSDKWIAKTGPARYAAWRKAAEGGDAKAMQLAGRCLEVGAGAEKDEKQAIEWYRKAADLGNVRAMHSLGVCYDQGTGMAKDEKKAAEWYRKAADLSNVMSMHNLGVCYALGTGVAKDQKAAVGWYRKAADLGDRSAAFNLGNCYEYGNGVAKDEKQAVEWYRRVYPPILVAWFKRRSSRCPIGWSSAR